MLSDIKLKPKNDIKIRKFDKSKIYTQKLKRNIISIKDKLEYEKDNKESMPVEYSVNNVLQKVQNISNKEIGVFNSYGRNSTIKIKKKVNENIKKKYAKIKIKKEESNLVKNSKEKYVKFTPKIHVDFSNRNLKNNDTKLSEKRKKSYYISKISKQNFFNKAEKKIRRNVNLIKKSISKVNYLLIFGVSSIWIFSIILMICMIGAFTMYNDIPLSAGNDIVLVAKSQVGNIGGIPFWSWYGFNNRVEWCACFVSWCANQCDFIENGIFPKFSGCQNEGIPWFKERNLWQKENYIPKAGDIVFFDWENDGISDHVGIVEKCEENVVYTIEGNSNDMCKEKKYKIDSTEIIGYGTPMY